eukprot:11958873-Heterocapsa_arctica.AAC.1
MFAFGNHSLLAPVPEDPLYNVTNSTEKSSEDTPIVGGGDPSRKTVAEYLEYFWAKPAANGNPLPGSGDQSSYL